MHLERSLQRFDEFAVEILREVADDDTGSSKLTLKVLYDSLS